MNNADTKEPLRVTVVIPAYNSQQYIARAVDSVLNQTRSVDEIIVVDDGSADKTIEIVKCYGEKVRYLRQENAGASAARNTGILAANSDWIAFLDADDEWLPDKIERQMELLVRNPHLVWVTGNYIACSCNEHRQAPRIQPDRARHRLGTKEYVEDYFKAYLAGLGGHTDTMVIRKNVLLEVGMFRFGQRKANDLDCWWRIAYRYPQMGFDPEPGAIYHLGIPRSISKKTAQSDHYKDLLVRHMSYSQDSGKQEEFRLFAGRILTEWMRSMLFNAQGRDIRELVKTFNDLFPVWYRWMMYALTVFPELTKKICLLISKIVRGLHLRRRVVVAPSLSDH